MLPTQAEEHTKFSYYSGGTQFCFILKSLLGEGWQEATTMEEEANTHLRKDLSWRWIR